MKSCRSPLLLCLFVCLQGLFAANVNKTIDVILQELAAESDPSDDQYKALLKFDKKLYEAYKSVTSEVPPLPSHWGQLGMMFYERDMNWKQGGGAEAASQVRVAMQLAALNHKQRTMQLRERQGEAQGSEGDTRGASEDQIRQIRHWLDQNKEQGRYGDTEKANKDEEATPDDGEDAFLSHLRQEAFAWSLQMAILDIHLGKGDKALKRLDFASKYADGSQRDLASLAYHRADAYLKSNIREPSRAYTLYAEALDLDGCASEAAEARLKLVQSKIAADAEEERALRRDILSGKIRTLSDEDEEEGEDEEVEGAGEGEGEEVEGESEGEGEGEGEGEARQTKANVEAVLQARVSALRDEKHQEWLEIAAIWSDELDMDIEYNVTVLAAACYNEHKQEIERQSQTNEGGLRIVGLPDERRLTSIFNGIGDTSLGAGIERRDATRGVASMMGDARLHVPPSTMLKWTLFTLWDHVAEKVVVGDDPDSEEVKEEYKQRAWDALEAAHEDEQRYRVRPKPVPKVDTKSHMPPVPPLLDDGLDEFFFDKGDEDEVLEAAVDHDGVQRASSVARTKERPSEKAQKDFLTNSLLDVGDASSTTLSLDMSQMSRNLEVLDEDSDEETVQEKTGSSYYGYSLSQSAKMAQTLKKTFVKSFWPAPKLNIGSNSTELVFIVGFFRSGSTLLEKLLTRHPSNRVFGIGEHSPMNMELKALEAEMLKGEKEQTNKDGDNGKQGKMNTTPVRAIRKAQHSIITKMRARAYNGSMAYTGYQPLHAREGYSREPLFTSPPSATSTSGESGSSVRVDNENEGRFVVDKMLMNYRNIGLIHLLFPHATILHMVRDPMDTLWSCYKTRFADDSASYTIDVDLLAQEYGLYIDIMRHFREQMPRASVIDINYETLVTQPRKTTSLILRRMGRGGGGKSPPLGWSEDILSFHEGGTSGKAKAGGMGPGTPESALAVTRTASYLQVRQPLYHSSIGAWRRYKDHIEPLRQAYRKHVYGPLLDLCNRDPEAEDRTFPFSSRTNWAALAEYDYEKVVETLSSGEWSEIEAVQLADDNPSEKKRKKKRKRKKKSSA